MRNKKKKQRTPKEKKKDDFTMKGKVVEILSNSNYRVKLENGVEIISYLAGKMKIYHISIILGDEVLVSLSPTNLTHGRIVYRFN